LSPEKADAVTAPRKKRLSAKAKKYASNKTCLIRKIPVLGCGKLANPLRAGDTRALNVPGHERCPNPFGNEEEQPRESVCRSYEWSENASSTTKIVQGNGTKGANTGTYKKGRKSVPRMPLGESLRRRFLLVVQQKTYAFQTYTYARSKKTKKCFRIPGALENQFFRK